MFKFPQPGSIPQPNPSYPMAGLKSSAYAPPLNYNQPTEVVGGYDAKINPMTGQEMPVTNFARGGLASLDRDHFTQGLHSGIAAYASGGQVQHFKIGGTSYTAPQTYTGSMIPGVKTIGQSNIEGANSPHAMGGISSFQDLSSDEQNTVAQGIALMAMSGNEVTAAGIQQKLADKGINVPISFVNNAIDYTVRQTGGGASSRPVETTGGEDTSLPLTDAERHLDSGTYTLGPGTGGLFPGITTPTNMGTSDTSLWQKIRNATGDVVGNIAQGGQNALAGAATGAGLSSINPVAGVIGGNAAAQASSKNTAFADWLRKAISGDQTVKKFTPAAPSGDASSGLGPDELGTLDYVDIIAQMNQGTDANNQWIKDFYNNLYAGINPTDLSTSTVEPAVAPADDGATKTTTSNGLDTLKPVTITGTVNKPVDPNIFKGVTTAPYTYTGTDEPPLDTLKPVTITGSVDKPVDPNIFKGVTTAPYVFTSPDDSTVGDDGLTTLKPVTITGTVNKPVDPNIFKGVTTAPYVFTGTDTTPVTPTTTTTVTPTSPFKPGETKVIGPSGPPDQPADVGIPKEGAGTTLPSSVDIPVDTRFLSAYDPMYTASLNENYTGSVEDQIKQYMQATNKSFQPGPITPYKFQTAPEQVATPRGIASVAPSPPNDRRQVESAPSNWGGLLSQLNVGTPAPAAPSGVASVAPSEPRMSDMMVRPTTPTQPQGIASVAPAPAPAAYHSRPVVTNYGADIPLIEKYANELGVMPEEIMNIANLAQQSGDLFGFLTGGGQDYMNAKAGQNVAYNPEQGQHIKTLIDRFQSGAKTISSAAGGTGGGGFSSFRGYDASGNFVGDLPGGEPIGDLRHFDPTTGQIIVSQYGYNPETKSFGYQDQQTGKVTDSGYTGSTVTAGSYSSPTWNQAPAGTPPPPPEPHRGIIADPEYRDYDRPNIDSGPLPAPKLDFGTYGGKPLPRPLQPYPDMPLFYATGGGGEMSPVESMGWAEESDRPPVDMSWMRPNWEEGGQPPSMIDINDLVVGTMPVRDGTPPPPPEPRQYQPYPDMPPIQDMRMRAPWEGSSYGPSVVSDDGMFASADMRGMPEIRDTMVRDYAPEQGYAHGGVAHGGLGSLAGTYAAGGKLLRGPGDGMSDSIPAVIHGNKPQRAALADGEFVIPADVVSHLGNGSTDAGARKLYDMMDKIRKARTGRTRQAPEVSANRYMPRM